MRFLLWLFLATAPLAFAQDVGRVTFLSGESDLVRGAQKSPLQLFTQVRQGDVIRTGADGHVQLVMVDGARIAVRPKSELSLERYEFNETSPGAGRALLSLLTGTIRVFTGEIVNRDRDSFKMKTNLAYVGIRGSGNILANLEGGATFNHTLEGAHSVTSRDALGVERTVISYPGQTVQVLPHQAPRFVPTPQLIMQAASPPATRTTSDKTSDTAASSSAGGATSSASASSSGSSSSSSSGSSSSSSSSSGSGTTTASSGGESSPPSSSTSSSSSTSTAPTTATTGGSTSPETPPTTSTAGSSTSTMNTSTSGSSTIATAAPNVSTSQANNGTVGSSFGTAQPSATSGYEVFFRFANPLSSGGYEGAIGSTAGLSTGALFDAAGRLVQIRDGSFATFLAGPGAVPPGYSETAIFGDIAFSGGTHRDDFRSPDQSVVMGRWEGGTVSINDGSSTHTYDLGPRSASYGLSVPTPAGLVGSFTGTATYTLASATAPTDAAGRAGSVGSATVLANFSSRTVSGNFGLSINGQAFSLSGASGLDPGSSAFSFASSLSNLNINCSGNCSTLGYLGTMTGQFSGSEGRWLLVDYRLNPGRAAQGGFPDFIAGDIALEAGSSPTIGITLPRTGSVSLAFNGVDPSSFSTYAGATGTPSVSGSVQANFSNQTASFNATITGTGSPTFTASASSMPIVGAGFSASTDTQRGSNVAPMSVSCSGSACGSSPVGRFDGLFRNSAGTTGVAAIVVGDTQGAYDILAGFGSSSASAVIASDARALVRNLPGNVIPMTLLGGIGAHSFARIGRSP